MFVGLFMLLLSVHASAGSRPVVATTSSSLLQTGSHHGSVLPGKRTPELSSTPAEAALYQHDVSLKEAPEVINDQPLIGNPVILFLHGGEENACNSKKSSWQALFAKLTAAPAPNFCVYVHCDQPGSMIGATRKWALSAFEEVKREYAGRQLGVLGWKAGGAGAMAISAQLSGRSDFPIVASQPMTHMSFSVFPHRGPILYTGKSTMVYWEYWWTFNTKAYMTFQSEGGALDDAEEQDAIVDWFNMYFQDTLKTSFRAARCSSEAGQTCVASI